MAQAAPRIIAGRGAVTNPAGRFAAEEILAVDDGWYREEAPASVATEVRPEAAKTIITRNASPDIPFDRSVNPYRGCEHGCIYCYARPAHAYVDLSPGLDFETRIFFKADAEALLVRELAKPGYQCRPIAFGTNTDPYQPLERRLRVTRRMLEVLSAHDHPVTITTKGVGVLDDLDLLADMAQRNLVSLAMSITTLQDDLKRTLEPRTASATARLRAVAMDARRREALHPGARDRQRNAHPLRHRTRRLPPAHARAAHRGAPRLRSRRRRRGGSVLRS